MNKKYLLILNTGLITMLIMLSCSKSAINLNEKMLLSGDWKVQQSSVLATLPGLVISGETFDASSWYPATVPSTIMGVLTANGLYENIFMDDSIKGIDETQFERSWWYRRQFTLPGISEEQRVMLNFDGISYYANIWLNGKLVASRDSVFGTFRRFEFDITGFVKADVNTLAVEIFKQKPGDFGHGFVDWNPAPPDDNMGIWREVYLNVTGDVAVKNTFVKSDVNTETLDEATLTITTDVVNYSPRAVSGRLNGKSENFEFSIPVHLKGGETKQVTLTSEDVKALHISHPKLWWCNNLGDPNLYNLTIEFVTNNAISDRQDIAFGIREVETYTNEAGHKGFKLNGKEVLIKGAGWTDDIFLRDTPESNEIQVKYVKHMNLNTIRFENIWGTSQNVYDLCDKYGLLAMVGWSCQWEWDNYLGKECDEFGGIKSEADMDLMVESLEHQIRYLQNHPAIIVWMLGSDMVPRPALEKRYAGVISRIDNRPYLAAASVRTSTVSGPTGVKMNGPYNYVGPSYWYIDSVNGGAFGFNTETGPGPQIPVMETLLKMIPENKLWPINESWNFHCNPSESFGDLSIFNTVLFQRYGRPANLEKYLLKANVQGYEAMKGMFEAFRTNRPNSTGIVQWMLNSAWPSLYWQLYDYYLLPTSAYYAAKKANEPLQLIYNYGNNMIYAVNGTLEPHKKAKARIKILDIQGKVISSEELAVSLEANASQRIYKLPKVGDNLFLSLSLLNDHNVQVAENFYWLSWKSDVYDWEKSLWYYTPIKSSADFTYLNYMATAELELAQHHEEKDNQWILETKITNKSERIAFFVNLELKDKNNKALFPVFWDDNYLSLLPGETRSVSCIVPAGKTVMADSCTIALSGWNVKNQQIIITP